MLLQVKWRGEGTAGEEGRGKGGGWQVGGSQGTKGFLCYAKLHGLDPMQECEKSLRTSFFWWCLIEGENPYQITLMFFQEGGKSENRCSSGSQLDHLDSTEWSVLQHGMP